MNYEKQMAIYWAVVIICMWSTLIFASCVTNYKYVDGRNGRDIVRALGKLEAECESIEATTSRITGTADDIEDDVDVLRTVLLEYIRGVQRLRADIRQLQEQIEGTTTEDKKTDSNP